MNYNFYAKLAITQFKTSSSLLSILQGYYIFVLNLSYSLHVLEFLSLKVLIKCYTLKEYGFQGNT